MKKSCSCKKRALSCFTCYKLSERSLSRSKNEEKIGLKQLKQVAIKNLLQENWSNFGDRENTTTESLRTLAVS